MVEEWMHHVQEAAATLSRTAIRHMRDDELREQLDIELYSVSDQFIERLAKTKEQAFALIDEIAAELKRQWEEKEEAEDG